MRSLSFVLTLSLIMFLACVASEQMTDAPTVTRVDTAATDTAPITRRDDTPAAAALSTMGADPAALTDAEFEAAKADTYRFSICLGGSGEVWSSVWIEGVPSSTTDPRRAMRFRSEQDAASSPAFLFHRAGGADAAVCRSPANPQKLPKPGRSRSSTRTVTLRGQTPAETREVHFAVPALPTPVLDGRKRSCIGFPITASPRVKRMNVAMGANIYEFEGMHKAWRDPKWREFHRIAPDGSFGVNLWRIRRGVATFVDTVRVPGGPKPSFVQVSLEQSYPGVFRGGDVACLEGIKRGGPLMIYYDQSSEFVRGPWISVIEAGSSDPGQSFGAWTTISAEARPPALLDHLPSLEVRP